MDLMTSLQGEQHKSKDLEQRVTRQEEQLKLLQGEVRSQFKAVAGFVARESRLLNAFDCVQLQSRELELRSIETASSTASRDDVTADVTDVSSMNGDVAAARDEEQIALLKAEASLVTSLQTELDSAQVRRVRSMLLS